MNNRTIAAAVARNNLTGILDDAEQGRTTLILRHSRLSAALVPAADLETYRLFRRLMREVGETLEVSRDAAIIETVKKSQEAIDRGEIICDNEDAGVLPARRRSRKSAAASKSR